MTEQFLSDDSDYAAAGYTGGLTGGRRPALLVVDPVQAYTDSACGLYAGVEAAVETMKTVVGEARAAGIPIFITQVVLKPDGSDAGVFFRKVPALSAFLPGSTFGEFIPGLEPTADDTLITKQYPSAY